MLLHVLKSDPTAAPWFLASGAAPIGHPADVELVGEGTTGSDGEPEISVSALPIVPSATPLELQARRAIADGAGYFLLGFALQPEPGLPLGGGTLYVDPCLVIPVAFDTSGAGAATLGAIPDDPAFYDLQAWAQLVTLDPLGLDGKLALSTALELRPGD